MNERGDYEDAAAMLQGAVDRFVLTLRDDHKVTHHHNRRSIYTHALLGLLNVVSVCYATCVRTC